MASRRTVVARLLGLSEATFEEPDVGEESHRPTGARPVAEVVEETRRHRQTLLGEIGVARQERHPGLVLSDPRQPAAVVGVGRHLLGFFENPVGLLQRPAEDLDEPTIAQRRRQLRAGPERAQQRDALRQLVASPRQVALLLGDDTDEASSDRLVADVAGGERRLEHLLGIDLGNRRFASFDGGTRSRQLQRSLGIPIGTRSEQVECPARLTDRLRERADVERSLGGATEHRNRPVGDVVGHPLDRPDVADEFGRRRRMVRDLVDRPQVELVHDRRRAGMALRPRRLGERLVGDLADHVRSEPPPSLVDVEHAVLDQLFEVGGIERLAHFHTESLQRAHRAGCTEHGGVVDHLSLPGRQRVETRGDQCSERARQDLLSRLVPRDLGELGQEERVATAALEQLVGQAGLDRIAEHRGQEFVGLAATQRVERHPDHDRMVVRGWPIDLGVVALRGDQQDRSVDERAHQPSEQLQQQRVCPLQVVDPHHDGAVLRTSMDPLDHDLHEDLASLAGRDAVEFGWMTEEMHCALHEALQPSVGAVEPVELEALVLHELSELLGGEIPVGTEQLEQRRGDRRPDVGLAVRRADAGEHHDRAAREPGQRLVDQAGLAASRLARDGHDRTAPAGDETGHRGEQLALRGAPDEPHVVGRPADRSAFESAGDLPDRLGLFTPAHFGVRDEHPFDGG